MTQATDTEGMVRFIVQSLVEESDAVKVTSAEEAGVLTFEITVAPDDIGKVIGRQGRIIKAIRTLARAAGSTADTVVEVEVIG